MGREDAVELMKQVATITYQRKEIGYISKNVNFQNQPLTQKLAPI